MNTSTPRRQRPSPHAAPLQRSGAHRSSGGVLGALMPSALAVAAVASLITALAVWQGEQPDQPRAAASTTREMGAASPDVPATSDPAGGGTTPTPAASGTGPASPSTPDVATKAVGSDMEVVVLNQTSRGGLAGTVADQLRSSGWEVRAVGNFRGVVPATTVYFPGGAEADALALAEDLPAEPRVRPRFGNLSTTRLTVVVTDSYPG